MSNSITGKNESQPTATIYFPYKTVINHHLNEFHLHELDIELGSCVQKNIFFYYNYNIHCFFSFIFLLFKWYITWLYYLKWLQITGGIHTFLHVWGLDTLGWGKKKKVPGVQEQILEKALPHSFCWEHKVTDYVQSQVKSLIDKQESLFTIIKSWKMS